MSAKIFAAMVKAQKEYGPALKRSMNPHFGKKYADLAACIEAVIDALNNNGIAMTQMCHESPDGVTVETRLLHESGEEWSGGKLFVPAEKRDPQKFGSALTYARRYSLTATCGIAPEDDDGNAASEKQPQKIPAPHEIGEVVAKCSDLTALNSAWKSLSVGGQEAYRGLFSARKSVLEAKEAA
jgi:hypothetical protein